MARKKGSKRLIDVGRGSKVNKFGVKFTASEIRTLRNEVQRVNARARTYSRQMQRLRQSSGYGIDSRIPVEPLFEKKSSSLHRFRSKDEFKNYLSKLRRQGSDRYMNYRFEVEKENFKQAIRSVFSPREAEVLIRKVNKKTAKKLHEAFITRKLEHTGFVYYDPDKGKFKQLLNQLDAI